MFTQSIRWRLQLWLAFLLVCVLTGFGVTVYQLQRLHQLNQIDEELGTRVSALSKAFRPRSEEHTSELQSLRHLVCRLLLEKKKKKKQYHTYQSVACSQR